MPDGARASSLVGVPKEVLAIALSRVPSIAKQFLSNEELFSLCDSAKYHKHPTDHVLVKKGTLLKSLFVIVQGTVKYQDSEKALTDGGWIGEMTTSPWMCNETVVTVGDVKVYEIDGSTVQRNKRRPIADTGGDNHEKLTKIIERIVAFKGLSSAKKALTVKAMFATSFRPGEYIAKQGLAADVFYIILSGAAIVTIDTQDIMGKPKGERHLRKLGPGSYFGDKALMKADSLRTANVIASEDCLCMTLQRSDFDKKLGDIHGAIAVNSRSLETEQRIKQIRTAKVATPAEMILSPTGEQRRVTVRQSVIENARKDVKKQVLGNVFGRSKNKMSKGGTALDLLRGIAKSVAAQTNRYRGSVYAKLRDRMRVDPALEQKFANLVKQMEMEGGYEEIVPISDLTQAILNKAPDHRTPEELELISELVLKLAFKRKCCQGWEASQLRRLWSVAGFREFPGNHTVFKEGEHAEEVYILLSGKMTVSKDSKQTVLKMGETFGDLVFLGMSKRPSTVVTSSRCECIVIHVKDYVQISGNLSIEDKFSFLSSLDLFEDWNPYDLYRLAFVLKELSSTKSSVLAKQGEVSPSLYFVYSGTVRCEHREGGRGSQSGGAPSIASEAGTAAAGMMGGGMGGSGRLGSAPGAADSSSRSKPRDFKLSAAGGAGAGGGGGGLQKQTMRLTNLGEKSIIGDSGVLQHFENEEAKDNRHRRVKQYRETATYSISSQSMYLLALQPEHYSRLNQATIDKMIKMRSLKERFRRQRRQFIGRTRKELFDNDLPYRLRSTKATGDEDDGASDSSNSSSSTSIINSISTAKFEPAGLGASAGVLKAGGGGNSSTSMPALKGKGSSQPIREYTAIPGALSTLRAQMAPALSGSQSQGTLEGTSVIPGSTVRRKGSVGLNHHTTSEDARKIMRKLNAMTIALNAQGIDQLLSSADGKSPFASTQGQKNPDFMRSTWSRKRRSYQKPKYLTPFQQRSERRNPLQHTVETADQVLAQLQDDLREIKDQRLRLDVTCRGASQICRQQQQKMSQTSNVQVHMIDEPLLQAASMLMSVPSESELPAPI